ncbi:flippase [Rhodobacteraceae bacterium CH30]|nr:flippase [Rhodobacteraceae bacterium CH30]
MSILRNSAWNIAGFIIPSVVAIPSLGIMARELGVERFGIFMIAFAIIGYASIFDAGLSRAVIREISIHRNNPTEQSRIIGTSLLTISILGLIGSATLFSIADLFPHILNTTKQYHHEVISSIKILSTAIPIFLATMIWTAHLEGLERFKNINLQKIASTTLIAGLPVLALQSAPTLENAILGLVIARLATATLAFLMSKIALNGEPLAVNKITFHRLIKFGGWITVSNIISPIMVYFDRFIISNTLGASKVGYYAAPSEAISKLLAIPGAIARALFPRLSSTSNNKSLHQSGALAIFIICLPICMIIFFGAEKIIELWLGNKYIDQSTTILKILSIGFLFNAMAQIPFTSLQSKGRSKTTALVHACEVGPYLATLLYLTNTLGLNGAAIAWSLRTAVDFTVLTILAKKL